MFRIISNNVSSGCPISVVLAHLTRVYAHIGFVLACILSGIYLDTTYSMGSIYCVPACILTFGWLLLFSTKRSNQPIRYIVLVIFGITCGLSFQYIAPSGIVVIILYYSLCLTFGILWCLLVTGCTKTGFIIAEIGSIATSILSTLSVGSLNLPSSISPIVVVYIWVIPCLIWIYLMGYTKISINQVDEDAFAKSDVLFVALFFFIYPWIVIPCYIRDRIIVHRRVLAKHKVVKNVLSVVPQNGLAKPPPKDHKKQM